MAGRPARWSTLFTLVLALSLTMGCPDETPPDDPPTLCDNNGPCGPTKRAKISKVKRYAFAEGFAICEGTCIAATQTCGGNNEVTDAGTAQTSNDEDAGSAPAPEADSGVMGGNCAAGDASAKGRVFTSVIRQTMTMSLSSCVWMIASMALVRLLVVPQRIK